MAFMVLGIIFIAKVLERCVHKNIIVVLAPICLIVFIALTCNKSSNFEFRNTSQSDLVQFQFAEIINSKPNATLLNYGFLDGGFYTVTGITPNIKYFHKPNISYENYPEIMDEQNRYIEETLVDFVVIRVGKTEESNDIPALYENYEEVKSVYVENVNSYYMLFKAKNIQLYN